MLEQDFLDLTWIDIGAAGNDQILGTVLQREIPVLIEGTDIAGMQPAVFQRRRGRFRIVPVARHHHIAAAKDFPGLSGRQRPSVVTRDLHLQTGIGPPRREQPLAPARMLARRNILFRQVGDGHRAFALPVDLREPRSKTVERAQRILEIHRRAAPDDGADILRGTFGRAIDHPLHHGGRREHRQIAPSLEQRENLFRLEAAGFRNDVDPEPHDMRHDVEAGAVAHRRRMQDRIARRNGIDFRRIGVARLRKIAVRQHRAFRPAGGAGSVKQPGQIVAVSGRAGDGIGRE
jgi:hypothetical protein